MFLILLAIQDGVIFSRDEREYLLESFYRSLTCRIDDLRGEQGERIQGVTPARAGLSDSFCPLLPAKDRRISTARQRGGCKLRTDLRGG